MRRRWAFTLIELLIVVAIIGILAAIAVPNFLNAQVRAKVARAEGDMQALSTALEMYNLDNGAYPPWMNTSNDLGKYGLKKLTTPTSYIGTALLLDPFMSAGTSIADNYPPPYYYTYLDRPTTIAKDYIWTNYDPEEKFKWFLMTNGPDQQYYHDSGPYNWMLPYTMTNGVNSLGNIYLQGPGNAREIPNYFYTP